MMTAILVFMALTAVIFGAATGRGAEVGSAALDGARAAVEFCLSVGGLICLWTGVMEVLRRSGLMGAVARVLRPALSRLFPVSSGRKETMDALCANVAANLLGLGNAATPMGIRVAEGMARIGEGEAGDELCMLVVVNTASIQLLPTTIASVRAAAGAENAFDILPAVWLASVILVTVGIASAKLLSVLWRRR